MRRLLRWLAERAFTLGYRAPHTSWRYALANGLESAWTVEQWRHKNDGRANRDAHLTLPRVFFVEAAMVLKHATTDPGNSAELMAS